MAAKKKGKIHKTVGFVLTCVMDALKAMVTDEIEFGPLHGGFTDVGRHSGCDARNTSRSIAKAVFQTAVEQYSTVGGNVLCHKLMAQFHLWLLEAQLLQSQTCGKQGASGAESLFASSKLTEHRVVYRALRRGEWFADDDGLLLPRDPTALSSPAEHIENGSELHTQFISTTKSLAAALYYAEGFHSHCEWSESAHLIVAIDLDCLEEHTVHDVSSGDTLDSLCAKNYAQSSLEVLVEGCIPQSSLLVQFKTDGMQVPQEEKIGAYMRTITEPEAWRCIEEYNISSNFDEGQVNTIMQMLAETVKEAAPLLDQGYPIAGFEERCDAVRSTLETLVGQHRQLVAKKWDLPALESLPTRPPMLQVPERVEPEKKLLSLSALRQLAEENLDWLPVLSEMDSYGTDSMRDVFTHVRHCCERGDDASL